MSDPIESPVAVVNRVRTANPAKAATSEQIVRALDEAGWLRSAGSQSTPQQAPLLLLRERLHVAAGRLNDMSRDVPHMPDRARLSGKREGVLLAVSYIEDALRAVGTPETP
jgi:hypothetical protein